MAKIRFAIIGTNTITRSFLKAARKVEDFELNAVYSRTLNKAEEFAEEYKVKNIFTDLEEMAKFNGIDAVYIASPNALHKEQSILFMNNGKHVLCEKAFASNVLEVNEMIRVAKENNVLLMEAMKTIQVPGFKELRKNLYKIGKVRKYFASYCKYSSRYDKYKEGIILNAFKKEFSNGALMDIGVYTIAPMVSLFGKPKEIKANAYMLESGVDGEGVALFNYGTMDGSIIYSKISNSYLPSEIQGEEGSVIIERINEMNDIKIIYRDGKVEEIYKKNHEDDMIYEIEEFINLINKRMLESAINSLQHSKDVMEVMEEIRNQIGLVYPADKEG